MTSILIAAVAALMIPTIAMATIGDVLAGPTATANPGNGRAIAYDGLTTLYYTNSGDSNIYRQATGGGDLGPIPLNNRGAFTCGALDFDGTNLICGTYDGSPAGFWSINPTTGFATLLFTEAMFNNFPAGPCFSGTGFVDGLAKDIDGTFWVSDDASSNLLKLNADGTLAGTFVVPSRTGSALTGCNSGIDIAGPYLELVLVAFEADAADQNHEIVKVTKADPTTVIVRFPTNNAACCEGISIDANTFAPLAALWTHATSPGDITAYEVQITRTIGFWKNHADLAPGLPIDLGDNSDTGTCRTVDDAAEVETVLKAHKGKKIVPKLQAQLLVAKLNVALGDIPEPDLTDMQTAIVAADALLSNNACAPDLSKFAPLLSEARTLHGTLDDFNNKYSL